MATNFEEQADLTEAENKRLERALEQVRRLLRDVERLIDRTQLKGDNDA